jgi:polyisoprenoid-binding protein YceI
MKLLPTLALALTLPAATLAAASFVPANSAPSPAAAVSAPAQAPTYKIDAIHSSVLFRVKHFGVTNFYGRFNKVSGEITWDAKKPETGSISVEIDAASIDSNDKKRDEHLRNSDFLSAKEFPTIAFKSKSVKKKGEQLEVSGDLTLHGVTKPVTAFVDITGEAESPYGYRAGFEAVFDIKRADYGMEGVDGIGDDVRIIVSLEAIKS